MVLELGRGGCVTRRKLSAGRNRGSWHPPFSSLGFLSLQWGEYCPARSPSRTAVNAQREGDLTASEVFHLEEGLDKKGKKF